MKNLDVLGEYVDIQKILEKAIEECDLRGEILKSFNYPYDEITKNPFDPRAKRVRDFMEYIDFDINFVCSTPVLYTEVVLYPRETKNTITKNHFYKLRLVTTHDKNKIDIGIYKLKLLLHEMISDCHFPPCLNPLSGLLRFSSEGLEICIGRLIMD